MKESDMFQYVKNLLLKKVKCSEVYAEVGVFDIVGIKGDLSIVVEMKKQLSFKVIEQAIRAKYCADYVFVAVPKPKQPHSKLAIKLLKDYDIGLIYVTNQSYKYDSRRNGTDIEFWGKRQKRKTHDVRKYIKPDFHSRTTAGVKSGEGITEYGEMIDEVKLFLKHHRGWATVDEILENAQKCHSHYSRPKPSLMATLKAHWNADWCEYKVENRKTYFRYKRKRYRHKGFYNG